MQEPIPQPEHIDGKLMLSLWFFLIIGAGLLYTIGSDIFEGQIGPFLAVLGVGIGVGAGTLIGRLLNIGWHADKARVVYKLDLVGVLVLGAYFVFEYYRNSIVGYFIHGPALSAFTLALLAGVLFGRFLGMRISIVEALASRKRRRRRV